MNGSPRSLPETWELLAYWATKSGWQDVIQEAEARLNSLYSPRFSVARTDPFTSTEVPLTDAMTRKVSPPRCPARGMVRKERPQLGRGGICSTTWSQQQAVPGTWAHWL